MQSAFPVQERPARNALTVGVNCVNPTRKHAAFCNGIFCPSCLSLPFSAAPQSCISRPRSSGAKKGLKPLSVISSAQRVSRPQQLVRGHAHERSRGTADHHLSCTEQSGRKKSDTFCSVHILPPRLMVTVSCASTMNAWLCRRLSWAVLHLPKFFIPNGKMNTKLRFWSLTVKSS